MTKTENTPSIDSRVEAKAIERVAAGRHLPAGREDPR